MCITAIISAGLGLVGAAQEAKVARESTQRAYDAEAKNLDLIYAENTRLQREAHEIYDAEVDDRIRQANRELGTLNVLMGEQGVSAASGSALVIDSEYTTGMDLARIDTNRGNQIEQLQSKKRAGEQGYLNQTTLAYNQGSAAVARANSSAINSISGGVSTIGRRKAQEDDYNNKFNYLNNS